MNLYSRDRVFYGGLICCFFLLGFIGIVHHELWLDEAHHWLVARDSSSIGDLFKNMRYDGHPILWNLLLFMISRFSDDPLSMQLLNLVFSSLAVTIFLFNAPFSKFQKTLFIFSYFMLFEYTIISRNYSLILLLAFLYLSIDPFKVKNYLPGAFIIAALMNTHLFGLFVGISMTIIFLFDFLLHQEKERQSFNRILISLFIIAAGLCLSLYQIIPPKDSRLAQSFLDASSTGKGQRLFSFFVKGFLPVPDMTNIHFWNSNFLVTHARLLASLFSVVLSLIPLFLFRRKPLATIFFYATALLLMMFFYITNMSASRYSGIVFMTFILSHWISQREHSSDYFKLFSFSDVSRAKISKWFIAVILIIQVLTSIPFYYIDLIKPFSESEATAQYLKDEKFDTEMIAVYDCQCTALDAFLPKKLYYLRFEVFGSFCPWNKSIEDGNIVQRINLLAKNLRHNLIFVHSEKLNVGANLNIIFLKKFTSGMVGHEDYYVYRVVVQPN